MTAISTYEALPELVDRAALALASARTSAEVLEVREMAGLAYDAAKRAARMARVKDAHDAMLAAAHRAQGHALLIESRAKMRLADEYDAAQDRGEVAGNGQRGKAVENQDSSFRAKAPDLGLTRQQVYEARRIRDAEAALPGVMAQTIDAAIAAGREPTRAAVHQGVGGALKAADKVLARSWDIGTRPKAAHVHERDPDEWYVEPVWAAAGLLRVERFDGPIWDPACGGGNVLRACLAAGIDCCGTDIVRRMPADLEPYFFGLHDFRDPDGTAVPSGMGRPVDVITNPPFDRGRGTEAFIRRALTLATGKLAVFVDVNFLAGQRRGAGLFAEHCPHRVWIHSVRPSCPPGSYLAAGNEAGGGSEDWCWMVWDLSAPPVERFEGGWIRPDAPSATAAQSEPLLEAAE